MKEINKKYKTINFNKIKIFPAMTMEDRDDAQTVLSRCHVLGGKKPLGQRITYLVMYDGIIVAVALFDAPVDMNKLRAEAIGWNHAQEKERKKYITNQSRFAFTPLFANIPNLASKILSRICARISQDWMAQYGTPILALETYVDPEHNNNQGTCYKANGWQLLGNSTGHKAKGKKRTHPKLYFLKALHRDSFKALSSDIPHALITGVKSVTKESNNNFVLDANKIKLSDLLKKFSRIEDKRKTRVIYNLAVILSLSICAVMSGYSQYRQIADWIGKISAPERARFGLPGNRLPDESTIRKLISKIDPAQIEELLNEWLFENFDIAKTDSISIDGKANRGTSKDPTKQHGFLNVYATNLGICIKTYRCTKGGGEKPVAKQAIKELPVCLKEGTMILLDALHTEQETYDLILKKKFNAIAVVKGNQPILHKQMQVLLKCVEDVYPELVRKVQTYDKGHDREETRELSVLSVSESHFKFKGINQIAKLKTTVKHITTNKITTTTQYLITNLSDVELTAEQFLAFKRGYWAIENKLHYAKDFVFLEDRSTIRHPNGSAIMTYFRSLAVSYFRANNIGNIKRCVDNIRYGSSSEFYRSIFL
jgi:predicted transposase YbfD/YdcC